MSWAVNISPHVLMLRPSAIITNSELQDFIQIIGLSVGVSLAATTLAAAISLPIGTALAIYPFCGRRLIIVLINAFFGLPPVVVGLILYLALSRSGPLGALALLFTPTAMIVAQTTLAPSPQSRPAPTVRALPPELAVQRGPFWMPIRGPNPTPIDNKFS
jgi:ABC-type sulfate transport system permease component